MFVVVYNSSCEQEEKKNLTLLSNRDTMGTRCHEHYVRAVKPSRFFFSEISIVVVVNVMHYKTESYLQLCTSKLQVVVQTALFKVERQT